MVRWQVQYLAVCLCLGPGYAVGQALPALPAKRLWPKEAVPDDKGMARLVTHIPRLSYPRGDRWPILAWHRGLETEGELQAWIDRGISPLYPNWHGRTNMSWVVPRLKQLQQQGVPVVLLAQSIVQVLFLPPKQGKTWPPGCDHLPPARSAKESHDFTCPAWMHENPHMLKHAKGFADICRLYKREGITPTAILIDFESGVYLRNSAEAEKRLRPAMEEAWKCPRCLKRFGKDAMDTLEEYSAIADKARAYATKVCYTDPVAQVFPECKTGNFYAWPINRVATAPGLFPAYGYEGSGMNVPQPRKYFTPGWAGCGRDEDKADWHTLMYCLKAYSPCAQVLKHGEVLVPWIGIVPSRDHRQEKARSGRAYATPEGYAEVVRHMLLRGAETMAVFNAWSDPSLDFPQDYGPIPRKEVGPWVIIMEGVQRGYDDMLRFNEILRRGKALNYGIAGEPRRLDETATVWSGVATDTVALVRTITFGPEGPKTIELFGNKVRIPFGRSGRFFWVTRDGEVRPVRD